MMSDITPWDEGKNEKPKPIMRSCIVPKSRRNKSSIPVFRFGITGDVDKSVAPRNGGWASRDIDQPRDANRLFTTANFLEGTHNVEEARSRRHTRKRVHGPIKKHPPTVHRRKGLTAGQVVKDTLPAMYERPTFYPQAGSFGTNSSSSIVISSLAEAEIPHVRVTQNEQERCNELRASLRHQLEVFRPARLRVHAADPDPSSTAAPISTLHASVSSSDLLGGGLSVDFSTSGNTSFVAARAPSKTSPTAAFTGRATARNTRSAEYLSPSELSVLSLREQDASLPQLQVNSRRVQHRPEVSGMNNNVAPKYRLASSTTTGSSSSSSMRARSSLG